MSPCPAACAWAARISSWICRTDFCDLDDQLTLLSPWDFVVLSTGRAHLSCLLAAVIAITQLPLARRLIQPAAALLHSSRRRCSARALMPLRARRVIGKSPHSN